jgi:hypothetical protein
MADALNRRLHDQIVGADAPTVKAARAQRIGVGNLIISRRNDPTIGIFDATDRDKSVAPVRNGNRWRVHAVDTEHHRIAARRLDDDAAAAFSGGYLLAYMPKVDETALCAAAGAAADDAQHLIDHGAATQCLLGPLDMARAPVNSGVL